MDHAYECWANRPGGVCREECSCKCHREEKPSMNAQLARTISQAVEHLIEMILDDDTPQSEIREIHIVPDPHNTYTHLCVYAELLVVLHGTSKSEETTYPYKYAIYINKETCQAETDGY